MLFSKSIFVCLVVFSLFSYAEPLIHEGGVDGRAGSCTLAEKISAMDVVLSTLVTMKGDKAKPSPAEANLNSDEMLVKVVRMSQELVRLKKERMQKEGKPIPEEVKAHEDSSAALLKKLDVADPLLGLLETFGQMNNSPDLGLTLPKIPAVPPTPGGPREKPQSVASGVAKAAGADPKLPAAQRSITEFLGPNVSHFKDQIANLSTSNFPNLKRQMIAMGMNRKSGWHSMLIQVEDALDPWPKKEEPAASAGGVNVAAAARTPDYSELIGRTERLIGGRDQRGNGYYETYELFKKNPSSQTFFRMMGELEARPNFFDPEEVAKLKIRGQRQSFGY